MAAVAAPQKNACRRHSILIDAGRTSGCRSSHPEPPSPWLKGQARPSWATEMTEAPPRSGGNRRAACGPVFLLRCLPDKQTHWPLAANTFLAPTTAAGSATQRHCEGGSGCDERRRAASMAGRGVPPRTAMARPLGIAKTVPQAPRKGSLPRQRARPRRGLDRSAAEIEPGARLGGHSPYPFPCRGVLLNRRLIRSRAIRGIPVRVETPRSAPADRSDHQDHRWFRDARRGHPRFRGRGHAPRSGACRATATADHWCSSAKVWAHPRPPFWKPTTSIGAL